jgi:NADPH2:quinone reductase
MKAVIVTAFGGPEVLQYKTTDIPMLGSKDVLIRVAATSINFADIKARSGQNPGSGAPPFTPGIDVAGTIEAMGSDVSQFQVGQRVIAFPHSGSYAEYTAASQELTFSIPDSLDFETAASSPVVSFTSYNLLNQAACLQAGETVLIHAAAGGIGTTAIQLAKLQGAKKVIGTVGNDTKAEIAYRAGADVIINHEKENFADKVLEITEGSGADVILDSIGGTVFENSMQCLARFGRIVHFGDASGKPGLMQTAGISANCRSVLGYSFGTYRKFRPETLKTTSEHIISLLISGQLKMMIGERFTFNEANKAHAWVESRKSTGKVLLLP